MNIFVKRTVKQQKNFPEKVIAVLLRMLKTTKRRVVKAF